MHNNPNIDDKTLFTFNVQRRTKYVCRTVYEKNNKGEEIAVHERFFFYTVQLWDRSTKAAIARLNRMLDTNVDTYAVVKS